MPALENGCSGTNALSGIVYCLIHCLVISIANLVAKLATVRHAVVIGIDLEAVGRGETRPNF